MTSSNSSKQCALKVVGCSMHISTLAPYLILNHLCENPSKPHPWVPQRAAFYPTIPLCTDPGGTGSKLFQIWICAKMAMCKYADVQLHSAYLGQFNSIDQFALKAVGCSMHISTSAHYHILSEAHYHILHLVQLTFNMSLKNP